MHYPFSMIALRRDQRTEGERNQEGINSDRTWSRCDREVRYGVYSRAAGLLRQRCKDHRTVSPFPRQLS